MKEAIAENEFFDSDESHKSIPLGALAESAIELIQRVPADWPPPLLSMEQEMALDITYNGPHNGGFE